ncbi:glucose-6-phosphate exchanger SLC37A2-like [Teleopsis dalmanni]|uniref:glucose-6-phosphate exchanger SLC37A2-like n=1 Tax=Teleopsis dalmanni TaxID=139649 RepID=UPI0018CF7AE8|nr:glucose-6-phosphate exchanger SLC37A2-like [Teleopsis dalmanni]
MIPPSLRRMSLTNDVPYGILAIQKCARICCPRNRCQKVILYKISVLFLTYLSYTCYHMSRKPISVVKSVLNDNCTNGTSTHCGYAPFNTPDGPKLFGEMDSAFLFTYALAMFASGFIAERVSLRYYLCFGMILSGLFQYLFGLAKILNIHNMTYFLLIQIFGGIVQTTGWPGVVTLVGRWFGKSKRGLVFGIWNSHTSIGNILGTLIAAKYVESDWSLSFIVPAIIICIGGGIMFLFLAESPESVGLQLDRPYSYERINDSDVEDDRNRNESSESAQLLQQRPSISIIDALHIPGVIEFSFCLFFSKLVSYTFLYWLPLYIENSSTLGAEVSAILSTTFDVGGIIGAIAAGGISDKTGMPATVCMVMLLVASPVLLLYQAFGSASMEISIVLLILGGIMVNGPYALITTAVSAELGTHSTVEGNAKALATVTAIIDGTGSIGAAVGPLLAGVFCTGGWQQVFHMLIMALTCAMILLIRLVAKECINLRRNSRTRSE